MPSRPETLDSILLYFPENSHEKVRELFLRHSFNFTITRPNKTKLGSFKSGKPGTFPTIYINNDLGKYTFLLIFLHELAHFIVWQKHKRKAAPHGVEWKNEYIELVIPFFIDSIFPDVLVPELKKYFRTTAATLHRSVDLIKILASIDGKKVSLTVHDLPLEATFTLSSGKQFVKMEKLRTRYKCYCPADKKFYLVPKSAQIIQP